MAASSVLLFKGGPSLIDLLIDANELRITVNGPRMLFERLQLVTTLSAFEGYTAPRLRRLAEELTGEIRCGAIGVQKAAITVASYRSGAVLEVDLGPPNTYQSDLVLRTRTDESFRSLMARCLALEPAPPYFVGLMPVTATGHLEHAHPRPPSPVDDPGASDHPHGDHGHPHDGAGHGHS